MRAIISLVDYNSPVPEWSFYFGGSLISLGEFGLTFLDWPGMVWVCFDKFVDIETRLWTSGRLGAPESLSLITHG